MDLRIELDQGGKEGALRKGQHNGKAEDTSYVKIETASFSEGAECTRDQSVSNSKLLSFWKSHFLKLYEQ